MPRAKKKAKKAAPKDAAPPLQKPALYYEHRRNVPPTITTTPPAVASVDSLSGDLLDRIRKSLGFPPVPNSELPMEIDRLRGLGQKVFRLKGIIERLCGEVPRTAENDDLLMDAQDAINQ